MQSAANNHECYFGFGDTMNACDKPVISAVILARNEEHNIRFCLETIRWCDEIVLVDMESSDRTVEIAREYTDRIFTHGTVTAFDIAKKFAVEQARGEWILLIDADEMIPALLADSLQVAARENSADVIEIPFQHYIMGDWVQHSGWGYTPLPRFFRKGSISFEKTIHGYMHAISGMKVRRLEPIDKGCIVHFNYTDSRHFVEKLNRYTSIEADHLHERQIPFSYRSLAVAAAREFHGRFIKGNGYRDGVRGFALCAMMTFYRVLTYIKLWERIEFERDPVESRYRRLRDAVLADWQDQRP